MKSYRIARIVSMDVVRAMDALYADSALTQQSYDEQQSVLLAKGVVFSDAFSRSMRALGHEAHEIIANLKPLQWTWAKENNLQPSAVDWQIEIVLAQIEKLRPDIVYLQDIHSLPLAIRKSLKQRFPFLKMIVLFKGFPGPISELGDVDLFFVGTPTMVEDYRKQRVKAHLLYHAFDESILEKLGAKSSEEMKYNFTFVGSSGYGWDLGHQARYWSLVELGKRTSLEFWVDERLDLLSWSNEGWFPTDRQLRFWVWNSLKQVMNQFSVNHLNAFSKKKAVPYALRKVCKGILLERSVADSNRQRFPEDPFMQHPRVPNKPLARLFPKRCHPPVYGLDMYRVLAQSRITFNRHTDAASGTSANIRMFEATGVGTCLFLERTWNLKDVFEDGKEVLSYSSIEECVEKVSYLMAHENERKAIALAGQKRTLRDHTIQNRCVEINQEIQKLL